MKELTIEEKARAYDEAFNRAKSWYTDAQIDFKKSLETLFPGLKCDDEKIRKEIIKCVKNYGPSSANPQLFKNMLAWLEKQGEQKQKQYDIDILEKHITKDSISELAHTVIVRNGWEIVDAEEQKTAWSEKQSEKYMKHGYIATNPEFFQWIYDRLKYVYNENPNVDYMLSLKERIEDMQKFADKIKPKFKVDDWIIDNKNRVGIIVRILDGHYIISFDGRKVQIPFEWEGKLFRKWAIQDAKDGDMLCTYECGQPKIVFILKGTPKKHYALSYHCYYNIMYPHFASDSEKGCLAPNDEDVKPATKEQRDTLFAKMKEAGYEWNEETHELKEIEDEEYNGEDYGIDSLYHAQRILEKTLGSVDGYQTDDGILSHKCAITAVKKLYKQKPTEWSEEDKERLTSCIQLLKTSDGFDTINTKWLKSLKERYTWKPSDEQMDALLFVAQHYNPNVTDKLAWDSIKILELMHHDLKKLKT